MECGIWDAQKISIEEYGVNIINRLTLGLELGIILIKVCVYLINVAVLLDCKLCELTKICPERCIGGIAIKSGQHHDRLVHERGNYLELSVDSDFIIFAIDKQHGFGLLGEAVV